MVKDLPWIINWLTLWGPRCIWGPDISSLLFSGAYKHINGTDESTLYLAETGLP